MNVTSEASPEQMHPGMLLGKKQPKFDGRTFRLSRFTTPAAIAKAPKRHKLTTKITKAGTPWGMMLNDELGCHDAKTEVLTEKGWQRWPDYDGSPLATMNPVSGLMEFQSPLGIVRYDYDGPLYFTGHNSLDFALTPNHRMLNRPYVIPDGRNYKPGSAGYGASRFTEIQGLPTRVSIPAAPTGFIGANLDGLTIGQRSWNGDDLIALIALVISDGWVGGTEVNKRTLSFCCFREDRRDKVESLAHRCGIHELPGRRGVWKFNDPALAEWFRANCVAPGEEFRSPSKRVPQIIKAASMRQLNLFLDYFGDQHINADGERSFFSASPCMIDDLQEVLLKTGKRPGVYSRPMRGYGGGGPNGNTDYTIMENRRSHIELSKLKRLSHYETDYYKGEVFCATVPNSTLITRRNGTVLVSGNCCTCSSIGHMVQVWTSWARPQIETPSDSEIHELYYRVNDGVDRGAYMLDVLREMRHNGFSSAPGTENKILAYMAIERTSRAKICYANWLFGGVYLGFNLPVTALSQGHNWEYLPSTNGNEAGSWGGHAVSQTDYSTKGYNIVSWGSTYHVSWAFHDAYCDELYAIVTSDWIKATGRTQQGFNLKRLMKDLEQL